MTYKVTAVSVFGGQVVTPPEVLAATADAQNKLDSALKNIHTVANTIEKLACGNKTNEEEKEGFKVARPKIQEILEYARTDAENVAKSISDLQLKFDSNADSPVIQ